MATRRHPALPKLALAAALGATALATTTAAHAAARSADSHTATASASGWGDLKDWNTMVPEGSRPAQS